MRTAILAGVFACLAAPAFAQGCYDYEATIEQIESSGGTVVEIPDDKLDDIIARFTAPGADDITRGFVSNLHGRLAAGLELDGCLLPPIPLGFAT